MFKSIKGIVGSVSATEARGVITIYGVNGRLLVSDIERTWKTTKFTNNIINKVSWNSISFNSFFATDILYCVEELLHKRVGSVVYTPRRALLSIRRSLLEDTWMVSITDDHIRRPNLARLDNIKFKLLPHQLEFIENYFKVTHQYRLNGWMLSAGAGTGKTLTNIALTEVLQTDLRIFVVPKNSISTVWEYSLENLVKSDVKYWSSSQSGPAPTGLDTYIFHYEALDRALDLVNRMGKGWFRNKVVYIGLDESHNFNERGSQRTRNFIDLAHFTGAKHVVWSSGTPVKALGVEMIPLLRSIDPLFDKDSADRFAKVFGRSASRALDILSNRVGLYSHRVESMEVVTTQVHTHEVPVRIPNGDEYTLESIREEMSRFIKERLNQYLSEMDVHKATYDRCIDIFETKCSASELHDLTTYKSYIKQIIKNYDPATMKEQVMFCNEFELKNISARLSREDRIAFRHVRSIVKYVDLKVMGEALGSVLGRARSRCHSDIIHNLDFRTIIDNADSKTVIFTSYVDVANDIYELLQEQGYAPLLIHGSSGNDLTKTVDLFMTDDVSNPLVTTFQSMSTAVPLIAANTEIFINQPFRDHERVQAIARVNRLGQRFDCHIYDVLLDTGSKPNISTRSKDILEWSKEQVALIMGTGDVDLASLEALVTTNPDLDKVNDQLHIYQALAGALESFDPYL